MAIGDILARILNGGGGNRLSDSLVPAARGFIDPNIQDRPDMMENLLTNPGRSPSPAPMQAQPQMQPQVAASASPMGQAAPQPAGGGGGIGDFLGNMLMPQRTQRNQTVQWLQGQGMDEGTATLLAGNKNALQQYLLQRTQGADPMDALKMQKTQLEIEQMRNPTTDDIKEYNLYVRQEREAGREPLPFREYMVDLRRAGAQNITVGGQQDPMWGNAPTDQVWLRDDQGNVVTEPDPTGRGVRPVSVPISGSKADIERQQAEVAAEGKEEQQKTWNAIVDQEIGRALDIIGNADLPTTGMFGDWLSGVGGTAARDLRALLDTVKANAGFDRLQAMRDASPTGGALGQVSERELAFLQSTIGNLEQSQTAEQLKFNLQRLQQLYKNMLGGKRAYEGMLQGGGQSDLPEGVTEEDLRFTMEKHGLTREEVLERINAR